MAYDANKIIYLHQALQLIYAILTETSFFNDPVNTHIDLKINKSIFYNSLHYNFMYTYAVTINNYKHNRHANYVNHQVSNIQHYKTFKFKVLK